MKQTTDALDAIVDDERFNGDVSARVSDHNEVTLTLFAGYKDEQREIIRDEFGLVIDSESRGAASGDVMATVVDPDGDDPESVDTEMDADDAISMF